MGIHRLLPLLCLFLAAPVSAGTLYRCVGADGVSNYTSKRMSGAVCSVIAQERGRVSSMSATPASLVSQPSTVSRPSSVSQPASVGAAPAPAASAVAAVAAVRAGKQVVFRTAPAGGTLAASAAAGGRVTRGAVYKYDVDGVTHYTNLRPKGGAQATMLFSYIETCYACAALPNVNFGTVRLNTDAYQSEIRAAALQYGVEEAIVRAIIHAESAYRANARSNKGAQGLMQLIPATAARFGVTDAYDPAQNISGGVQYLAWLMKRYSSNLTLVAAAYNAGEGAVDRNGGVPPYAETQRYVARVGQLAERYRSALATR
jgi:soluble lytic murein transglycosylase-like protein